MYPVGVEDWDWGQGGVRDLETGPVTEQDWAGYRGRVLAMAVVNSESRAGFELQKYSYGPCYRRLVITLESIF
jgi:hypothetical protein